MVEKPDHVIVHPVAKYVARYSIYHPSKLKYSNIKQRVRFAPIAAASIKLLFQKTLHIPFNMELA